MTPDILFRYDLLQEIMKKNYANLLFGSPLELPVSLQRYIYIYFFHEKSKPKDLKFPKLPDQTIWLDMTNHASESIKIVNAILEKDTNGFVNQLGDEFEKKLKSPDFLHFLLCILYIKGGWDGILDKKYDFYNANGTINRNLTFFKLSNQVAKVEKNRISVDVTYTVADGFGFEHIRFSRSIPDVTQLYNRVDVYLPIFEINSLQQLKYGNEELNFNLQYKQNEKGFEVLLCGVICGTGYMPEVKNLYFDVPFTIEIFTGEYKILEIEVNNL